MLIKNSEILQVQIALKEIANQPTLGRLKFKIAKNMKRIDEAHGLLVGSLDLEDGYLKNTDSNVEILNEEQEVAIDLFEEMELEGLELSANSILQLEPLIKENENE